MQTNFSVIEAKTIPNNYSWDTGVPFETIINNVNGFITTNYVSGYAPGVGVVFKNDSVSDPEFLLRRYDWNFGDYYNDTTNNISVTGSDNLVSHIYIMPGVYTVSLKHTQTKKAINIDPSPDAERCKGLYNIRWFWGALECDKLEATKWSDTECSSVSATRKKRWYDEVACIQKYCKSWSWSSLKSALSGGVNPVTWLQSKTDQEFEKRWQYEANSTPCPIENADFLNATATQDQEEVKVSLVEVKELMPKAGMYCLTTPTTGVSPFTVTLTPRNCVPGSFPIDRIDWDFGDGTPIKTVIRYTENRLDPELVYNSVYISDVPDVRNYDIVHTYVRNKQTYSMFYPSLTCYSASTGSTDSCCITLGPIFLPQDTTLINLLKVRNTLKGTIFTFGNNENISFATTSVTSLLTSVIVPNEPTTRMQNASGIPINYFGNPGGTYPNVSLEELLATEEDITVFIHTQDDFPISLE